MIGGYPYFRKSPYIYICIYNENKNNSNSDNNNNYSENVGLVIILWLWSNNSCVVTGLPVETSGSVATIIIWIQDKLPMARQLEGVPTVAALSPLEFSAGLPTVMSSNSGRLAGICWYLFWSLASGWEPKKPLCTWGFPKMGVPPIHPF